MVMTLHYFTSRFYTLVELFCHRRRVYIQFDVYILHPVDDFCHRDPHFGIPSSHRFRYLSLCRLPTGWNISALLRRTVSPILFTCVHHLLLLLFVVCSLCCMFTRRPISSFLILSMLAFPAAFLRRLISVVVNMYP